MIKFKERWESAKRTYQEKIWVDGYKFTLIERVKRAIRNFYDKPTWGLK